MPLTPNNREEHWLQGMVDGETTLTPNNRREHWYKAIIDNGSGGGGGGGGGVLVVGMNTEIEGALNKTWKEIHDAAQEQAVVLSFGFGGTITQALLYQVYEYDGEYGVQFFTNTILPVFSTNTENGYPVANEG